MASKRNRPARTNRNRVTLQRQDSLTRAARRNAAPRPRPDLETETPARDAAADEPAVLDADQTAFDEDALEPPPPPPDVPMASAPVAAGPSVATAERRARLRPVRQAAKPAPAAGKFAMRDYGYVKGELIRIVALAAGIFAVLGILSLFW